MFLAGSGGKGGAAVAGQPASAHHLDYAAGHAQFARQDPGPSGSYAAQSDYEYVQGGSTYAPPGYAEYRDRVPSSSSGSGFDHSRYAVAPHAKLSHAPHQPSAGYHSYAAPYSNPADAQTMHDQAAWAQGGIAGQSPKLGAFLLSGGDPESHPQRRQIPDGWTMNLFSTRNAAEPQSQPAEQSTTGRLSLPRPTAKPRTSTGTADVWSLQRPPRTQPADADATGCRSTRRRSLRCIALAPCGRAATGLCEESIRPRVYCERSTRAGGSEAAIQLDTGGELPTSASTRLFASARPHQPAEAQFSKIRECRTKLPVR